MAPRYPDPAPKSTVRTWSVTLSTTHTAGFSEDDMVAAIRRGLIAEGTLADQVWEIATVEVSDRTVRSGEDYPRPDEDGAL